MGQAITLEGWVNIMYDVRQAAGGVAYDLYFIALVLFGALFMMNLVVAVLVANFMAVTGAEEEKNAGRQTLRLPLTSIRATESAFVYKIRAAIQTARRHDDDDTLDT